jgi:hypothetical protein
MDSGDSAGGRLRMVGLAVSLGSKSSLGQVETRNSEFSNEMRHDAFDAFRTAFPRRVLPISEGCA